MYKTMKQRWMDSFPPSMELWTLEHNDNKGVVMYETKEHVTAYAPDPENHRQPVYHVWQGDDKWVIATQNYHEAYQKYCSLTA